jgi:glucose/arabinose dehydrogenase
MWAKGFGVLFISLTALANITYVAAETIKLSNERSARIITDDLTYPVKIIPYLSHKAGLLVAERSGVVLSVDTTTGKTSEVIDIEDITRDDPAPGLLGISAADINKDQTIFLNYVDTQGDLVVARFILKNGKLLTSDDISVVLKIAKNSPNNLTGDLVIGSDGLLFIGTDDGEPESGPRTHTAQALNSLLGKIVRINIDVPKGYTTPIDNPFIKSPNALPEIWALGFRSPGALTFDSQSSRVIALDANEKSLEVNLIESGGNYGWDQIDGQNCDVPPCNLNNSKSPKIIIKPSAHDSKLVGGVTYRGSKINGIQNTIIFAETTSGTIFSAYEKVPGSWDYRELTKLPSMEITALGLNAQNEIVIATKNGLLLELL